MQVLKYLTPNMRAVDSKMKTVATNSLNTKVLASKKST